MRNANRYRHPDGTIYQVTPKGWRRLTPRRHEAKDRANLHNNSARRRAAGVKGR